MSIHDAALLAVEDRIRWKELAARLAEALREAQFLKLIVESERIPVETCNRCDDLHFAGVEDCKAAKPDRAGRVLALVAR